MGKGFRQFLLVVFIIYLSACTNEQKNAKGKEVSTEKIDIEGLKASRNGQALAKAIQKDGITVYPANIDRIYPDAVLKLTNADADFTEPGTSQFNFEVENYELTTQTMGAKDRHCANSAKGQHIHFILNNAPYQAKYEPSFEAELMEGNNVVLAFLSRSYHESIKNGKAFIFKNFHIGGESGGFDMEAQHLFYSRPKGTYSGDDARKILLDFYLINTALSEDGNRVRLTIDDSEFIISNWQPYFVEGLSKGKHHFRIELVDQSGELIEGPFNDSGEREITIE